jgi:ribose transport system permease protein
MFVVMVDKLKGISWLSVLKNNLPVMVAIILLIISSFMSDAFLTSQNIFNLLRQLGPPTLIAMGMLFVVMTGGIDLSVGSVVAMASVFTAHLLGMYSVGVTILLVLLASAAFGVVLGYLVAWRRLAAFVVTLAGMTIARGVAFIVSRGMPVRIRDPFLIDFATGNLLGVPYLVWFVMIIVVILGLIQKFTAFGRIVQSVGSNETATKLSGINTNMFKMGVYILSSVLAGISGIMIASRVGIGSPLAGQVMELDAIAAVVIGGASLAGGNGRVLNTLMGVWILGMIGNIMNLLNIPSHPQDVFQGFIIILAILLQSERKSKDIVSSSRH